MMNTAGLSDAIGAATALIPPRKASALFGKSFKEVFKFTEEQYATIKRTGRLKYSEDGEAFELYGLGLADNIFAFYVENIENQSNVRFIFEDNKVTDIAFGLENDIDFVQFMSRPEGFKVQGHPQTLKRFFPDTDLSPYLTDQNTELTLFDEDQDGDIDKVVGHNWVHDGKTVSYVEGKNVRIPNNMIMLPDPKI